MEGETGSTAATTTTVGSPVDEIPVLPSDEDHDHDEEDQNPTVEYGPHADADLNQKIIKQVEYYFSDENLSTDKYMISLIKKNKEGFVPISLISSFRKMKRLTRDHSFILDALRESSFLVVSSDGKKVKRLHPFPLNEFKDPQLSTIVVENLPEDRSVENIRKIFGEAGKIVHISICDPHAIEVSKKGKKLDFLISSKLHALIEYETVEAAEKAAATLNNEGDWRSGLRVKHLKRTGKNGHKRQAWREVGYEKNVTAAHVGDEDNHNSNGHLDDIADEENGEHLPKEKNGHHDRDRGRQRRNNKYRANNGMGHGNASSTHATEPLKPPPGPKMPDGTRGFTMGRGRPLVASPQQQVA